MANTTKNTQNQDQDIITLRCSRCGKSITPEEAIQTPTGYRCEDCVKQQQKIFDTSQPLDFVWGLIIATIVSFLGSLIASFIGFFTVLIAPAAGVAVAEIVRWVTQKRRSKRLFKAVSAGVILGGLPLIIFELFQIFQWFSVGSFSLFSFLPLTYRIIYLILAVPAAHYRISGRRR